MLCIVCGRRSSRADNDRCSGEQSYSKFIHWELPRFLPILSAFNDVGSNSAKKMTAIDEKNSTP
jgi:hypothetical protein